MKNSFFGLIAILLIALTFSGFAQSSRVYQIVWSAPPAIDEVVAWSVYLEQKTVNNSFVIQDGMDYSATIDMFYKADVINTGQTGEVIYEIALPLDGKWSVAGVIAYTSEGLKSPVGASSSIRISKRPGKPQNVQIRLAP